MKLPKAKFDNIVVQNLKDEVLVYNLITNQAFCLNDTAAKVFGACNGETPFDELKNRHQLTNEIIYLTLDELRAKNLLIDNYDSPFAGLSRREVIRKVGLASMIALPVITGLTAPPAASAQSAVACRGVLASCTFMAYQQSNCCNGLRCYETNQCNTCNPQGSSILCFGAGCCAVQGGNSCCNGYTESAQGANQRICTCQ